MRRIFVRTSILALAAAALVASCIVEDADLTANPAVAEFTLAPSGDAINVFTVDLTGSVTVGYTSNEEATLDIKVNGSSVYQESFAMTETRDAALAMTIPLSREGINEVVASLSYWGQQLTQEFTVVVLMDPPTVQFPTWTDTYTPHVGLIVAGDLVVTADAAYDVDSVSYSVDDRDFVLATDLGGGSFGVEIVDPDIADSTLTVKVVTSNDEHTSETIFSDTITIDLVFDCTTPTESMLPDNDMYRGFDLNYRNMVGYFGDPDGNHDVTFVISGTNGDGEFYESAGVVVSYGTTTLNVGFDVDRLDCNNQPCANPYDLEVFVDGMSHCFAANFGDIIRY